VFPTLGALCGVPAPKASQGVDFSATLRAPSRPARTELLFAYKNVQRALCDDRWKVIRYPKINRTQLFDLQTDPFETNSLAAGPKLNEMLQRLGKAQAEVGDQITMP